MKPYYEQDGITIYHGDALDVLPNLSGVDAVVTDPPFKLSQSYSASVDSDNLMAVSGVWGVAAGLLRVVRPGACAAVIYDNRIMPVGLEAFRRSGWVYQRTVTLYRRWGSACMLNGWMSTSDVTLIFSAPGKRSQFYGEAAHDVFTRAAPETESTGHPAQKPLAFLRQLVQRITPDEGLVVDPYAGSGTTLVAAQSEWRRAVGLEREERYCEIAAKRLSQGVLPMEIAG